MLKWLCVLAGVAALVGCGSTSGDGGVEFTAFTQGLSGSTVTRVVVTVSAPDISPPIVQTLTSSHGSWGGVIKGIPAGLSRSFHADAFDASNMVIYTGTVDSITITKNQTAVVAMLLQQTTPPTPFTNEVPRIDALVASTDSPGIGDTVTVQAQAHDPNGGDSLTFAWRATGGSFVNTSASATTWTAPASVGTQTLTLQVADQRGGMNAITFSLNVSAGKGSAAVGTTFNTWPVVSSVTAAPGRIDVGQATTVQLVASDPDGDALSYTWSASCNGTFSNPGAQNPQFTLSQLPATGSCALIVTVSDGRGGQNRGTISIQTGPGTAVTYAPDIDTAYQSVSSVINNDTVVFSVSAHDPQGAPLTFAWNANLGSLGNPSLIATNTSQVTWSAPSCFPAGTSPVIAATITDSVGVSTTYAFSLTVTAGRCWQQTTPLPSAMGQFGTAIANGFAYVVVDAVSVYAPIKADGSIGSWTPTTAPPLPRDRNAMVAVNGYLYILGGWKSPYSGNDVQYAKINPDGSVGAWTTTASFSGARYLHEGLAAGGRIYVAGGVDDNNQHLSDIQIATPNPDGSITAWTSAGTMPQGRNSFGAVIADGHFYAIGGEVAGQQLTSDVSLAPVNADGTLGAFASTTALPSTRGSHAAVGTAGRLCIAAGWLTYGGTAVNTTLTANLNADGSVARWNTGAPLLVAHAAPSSATDGTNMYVLGGGGPDPLSGTGVEYMALNVLAP